ncbi:hypothetical protein E1A91_D09G156100v1 [Gossypium mustelinum]|uniref:MADS-box domain-containing protein n=1 Tax=Gossypium mustelinum TaxID=34275 RepID=A0A5D2TMA8_GOSMU|nr:hypothetical protein E1A91_D09G156100v1 [Gossypium mustelinum]
MARKKVKLAWIENSSARRASLTKRRQRLVKKVTELTTLCGEPIVWPSREEVERLLRKFNEVPEVESMKRSMNLETYYKEMISKSQDQLRKQNRKNKEMEVGQLMLQIEQGKMPDDFNVNELDDLIWYGETMRTDIRKLMEFYEQFPSSSVGLTQGDAPLPPPPPQGRAPAVCQTIGIANAGVGDKDTSEVYSFFLSVTLCYQSSLVSNFIFTRKSFLLCIYPFASNCLLSLGQCHQLPSPIFMKRLHFFIHSLLPLYTIRVTYCFCQPRPSHGGSSRIAPESGLTGFSYGCSSSAAIEPRPSMPPFGYDSSSSVRTTNPELPPFEPLRDDLLKGNNIGPFDNDMGPGQYPLGPLESSSPASDIGGNPLRFFGGESSSHGAAGSCEIGPFYDKN